MIDTTADMTMVFAPDGIYNRQQWQMEVFKQTAPELKDRNTAALGYLPAHNQHGGKFYAIQVMGNNVVAILDSTEYAELTGKAVNTVQSLNQIMPPAMAAYMESQERNKGGRPRKVV